MAADDCCSFVSLFDGAQKTRSTTTQTGAARGGKYLACGRAGASPASYIQR